MNIVSKKFCVSTAHRLMNHPGRCKFLHGHNYIITVYMQANMINEDGMVIDFSEAKKQIKPILDDLYDHRTVLQVNDPLIDILQSAFQQVTITSHPPTAERMAFDIFIRSREAIKRYGVHVVQVDVEETPGSVATFKRDE